MVERSGRRHGRWRGLCKHCLELSPLCRLNLNRFSTSGARVFNSPQLSRASILPLVQRPDPFILICVHTFIFMLLAAPRSSTGPRRRFRDTQAFTVHGRGTEAWVQLDVCVRSQPRECAVLMGCHVSTEGVLAGWVNGSTNRLRKNCYCWVSIIVG